MPTTAFTAAPAVEPGPTPSLAADEFTLTPIAATGSPSLSTFTAAPDAVVVEGFTAAPDSLHLPITPPVRTEAFTAVPDSGAGNPDLIAGATSVFPPSDVPPPIGPGAFTAAPEPDATTTAPTVEPRAFTAAPTVEPGAFTAAPSVEPGAFTAAPTVESAAAPARASSKRPRQRLRTVPRPRTTRRRRHALLSGAGVAIALAISATVAYVESGNSNAPSGVAVIGPGSAASADASTPARPATAPGASHDANAIPLGDYAGLANPAGIQSFAAATGTHPALATDYLDRSRGWAALDSATNVTAWAHTQYRLVLGVPILPGTGTLSAGARGAYDAYFAVLARTLVSEGESNVILRLGWEFNTRSFRWSAYTATDAKNFAAYWRKIVITMRSVPGEQFRFLWNPSGSSSTKYSPDDAYPGDGYVDYVGTDVSDTYSGPGALTESGAWAQQLSEQWGLNWLASFAGTHGKPIAIPAWSDEYLSGGRGLGDDPTFIAHMASWFLTNNVSFAAIWSYDSSPASRHNILDGSFPKALAEFKTDFG